MRGVNPAITGAITNESAHKQTARLTVYKSRVYFDALTTNFPSSDAKAIAYTGNKLNEVSFLYSYESVNKVITAYVTSANNLYFMTEDSATPILALTGVNEKCKIGINPNNLSNVYLLYYYSVTNSRWEYRHIDVATLISTGSGFLSAVVNYFSEFSIGSIYPLEGTANTFVLFDIYEGAVRVRICDDNADTVPSKYRFINPLKVLSASTDDIYLLHKAGAVLVNGKVYVYFSHYDGSVKSMVCTLQSDMRHGVWSDIRVAVPQDLSVFSINNVFAKNDRIFLSGNFSRTQQFASIATYSLLVWSDDGITFTMNRRVLCTSINLPFQVSCYLDTVIFSCTNRIYKTNAPYYLIGESADHTVLSIVSISGSITGEFTANIRSGAEQYFNDPYIDTGSYAKLETFIESSSIAPSGFVKYQDVIISQNDKNTKDGGRNHVLFLMTDANWHTSVMTQPFYMEFQGKQTQYDPCADFSNLYKASTDISPTWYVSTEFWGANGTTFSTQTHNNATTRHWTKDFIDLFMSYPLFGSASFYHVNVYGWSRAGLPSTVPNTPDPTPTTTLNDKFYPVIEWEDSDGARHIRACTDADLVAPSYDNPPQTYFETHDGSYPVVFAIPNPGAGLQITHLGVDVVSRSPSNTTYYLERIEMPDITASIIINNLNVATFEVNNYLRTVGDKTVITNYMTNKRKGIPQIVFSTRPYSAWNFEITSRVEFMGIYSKMGLVGLAVDEQNFIAGIIGKNKIQIIQLLHGKTIVLEEVTATISPSTKYDLRLWHRDGIIGFEYKVVGSYWPIRGSIISHEWKAVDGPMAILDDVFHVGAYSFIDPPGFRITGMRGSESIVAAMPGDSARLADFPSNGQIDIDGLLYTYTGKSTQFITTPALGPYQITGFGKTYFPNNADLDGGFSYDGGDYVDVTIYQNLPGTTSADFYNGAILASSGGHSFLITQIQWRAWTSINGVIIHERESAKVYCRDLSGWNPSSTERVYITDGLTGVKTVDMTLETNALTDATNGGSYMHCPGVFAYMDSSDETRLYGFQATSGDHDQTIHLLLDLFCRLSGTHATFIGDHSFAQTITNGGELSL